MSLLNHAVALSCCTQSARKPRTLAMQDNPPFAELPTLDKGRCRRSSEIRLPYTEYATKLWG